MSPTKICQMKIKQIIVYYLSLLYFVSLIFSLNVKYIFVSDYCVLIIYVCTVIILIFLLNNCR